MDGGISKRQIGLSIQLDGARIDAERFIAERFWLMHEASVCRFMPLILGMRDGSGRHVAACGLREARVGGIFLEHYLAEPIEHSLSIVVNRPIDRHSIVEVGNLAVAHPASARDLIVALTDFLLTTSFEWVVFTAIPALRNAFRRLGIPLADLGEAQVNALPPAHRDGWGRYYNSGPRVCAVSVQAAAIAISNAGAQAA